MLGEFRAQATMPGLFPTQPRPGPHGWFGESQVNSRAASACSFDVPTGTDLETARLFHRLPGSRKAIEPEPACRGRPVCLRKSLDRYVRPSVMQSA